MTLNLSLHLFLKTSRLSSINFNPLSSIFPNSQYSHPQSIQDWVYAHQHYSGVIKNSLSFTFPSACSANSSLFICTQSRLCVWPLSLLQPTNRKALQFLSLPHTRFCRILKSTIQQLPSPPLLSIPVSTTATNSITHFPHLNSIVSNSYKMH